MPHPLPATILDVFTSISRLLFDIPELVQLPQKSIRHSTLKPKQVLYLCSGQPATPIHRLTVLGNGAVRLQLVVIFQVLYTPISTYKTGLVRRTFACNLELVDKA